MGLLPCAVYCARGSDWFCLSASLSCKQNRNKTLDCFKQLENSHIIMYAHLAEAQFLGVLIISLEKFTFCSPVNDLTDIIQYCMYLSQGSGCPSVSYVFRVVFKYILGQSVAVLDR